MALHDLEELDHHLGDRPDEDLLLTTLLSVVHGLEGIVEDRNANLFRSRSGAVTKSSDNTRAELVWSLTTRLVLQAVLNADACFHKSRDGAGGKSIYFTEAPPNRTQTFRECGALTILAAAVAQTPTERTEAAAAGQQEQRGCDGLTTDGHYYWPRQGTRNRPNTRARECHRVNATVRM